MPTAAGSRGCVNDLQARRGGAEPHTPYPTELDRGLTWGSRPSPSLPLSRSLRPPASLPMRTDRAANPPRVERVGARGRGVRNMMIMVHIRKKMSCLPVCRVAARSPACREGAGIPPSVRLPGWLNMAAFIQRAQRGRMGAGADGERGRRPYRACGTQRREGGRRGLTQPAKGR